MGTHAVINGKISSTGSNLTERLEDLMTSNIFQLLSYLPVKSGIIQVLSSAINLLGENILLPSNISQAYYIFWPRWTSCEPDLVISLVTEDKEHINLLIEAKLDSKLSTDDQLVREWNDMQGEYPNQLNYLIYLTKDTIIPKTTILNTRKLAKDKIAPFWLNYEMIFEQIEKIKEDSLIKEDLLKLLKHYHFYPFRKWSNYINVVEDYRFKFNSFNWSIFKEIKNNYSKINKTL